MARLRRVHGADDAFAEASWRATGSPRKRHRAASVSRAFRAWGAGANVTRPLRDGDELALRDRTLRVLHRPGHSPTDTVFQDAEARTLSPPTT